MYISKGGIFEHLMHFDQTFFKTNNLISFLSFRKQQNEKSKQLEHACENSYERSSIWLYDVRAEICAKNQLDQSLESAQQRENTFVQ